MQLLPTDFERRRFAQALDRGDVDGAIDIGKGKYEKGRLAMLAGIRLTLATEMCRLDRLGKRTPDRLRAVDPTKIDAAVEATDLSAIRSLAEQARLAYRWRQTRRAWIEYATVLRIAGSIEYAAVTENESTLPRSGRIEFRLAEDHAKWSNRKGNNALQFPTVRRREDERTSGTQTLRGREKERQGSINVILEPASARPAD